MASAGKRLGTTHPDYAVQLNNLATLLEDWRRYGEAEASLPGVARRFAATRYGAEHAAVARVEHSLGRVLLAMGRTQRRRGAAAGGPGVKRKVLPPGTSRSRLSLAVLGEVMVGDAPRRRGRAAADRRARDGARQSRAPAIPIVADGLLALSALDRKRGRPAAAEPLAAEAVAIRAASCPRRTGSAPLAEVELGSVLLALGRRREAQPLLDRRRRRTGGGLGERDPRVADVRALLASHSPA